MISTTCLTLIAFIICASDAAQLRGANERDLAAGSKICRKLGPGLYETQVTSRSKAWSFMFTGIASQGACESSTVCQNLCKDFSSFKQSGTACTCVQAAPKCGENAGLTSDSLFCQCLAGFEGDAFKGCTRIDQCQVAIDCASNQVCVSGVGSHTCQPIACANSFGNPCGPGSSCTDGATGYTCSAAIMASCPVGCGPNSTCVGALCECNSGFYRPKPYLGCVAKP